MQAAHGAGIIHRDIKPSNILVRADGVVKLLNFGISDRNDAPIQADAHFVSLPYAPPEHGTESAGVRGDIYSLGLLLFEMLTGQLSFRTEGLRPNELKDAILHAPRVSVSSVIQASSSPHSLGSVSSVEWREIDHICASAAAVDPECRYVTAEALKRDIRLHIDRRPLDTFTRSWTYIARRFVARNRKAVLFTPLSLLSVALLITIYTMRLRDSRDEARNEALRAERVETFLEKMFEGGGGDAGPQKDLKVLTLLDTGVRQARALSNDSRLQADLYNTLGGVYQSIGDYEHAGDLLQNALDERDHLFGPDSREASETLVALSRLRGSQQRFPEAVRYGEQSVAIDSRELPVDHPDTLRAETVLADAYINEKQDSRAMSILNNVERAETGRPALLQDLSITLGEVVIAQQDLGHLDEAEATNQQALFIDRKLFGPTHPDVAADLMNEAEFAEDRNDLAASAAFGRQALDIYQAWYGPDHFEVGAALSKIGWSLAHQGKAQEAIPILQRAVGIREKNFPIQTTPVANTLNALAGAYAAAGDLKQAAKAYAQAINIGRALAPQGNWNYGVILHNAGVVQVESGNYLLAESMFRQALTYERHDCRQMIFDSAP